MKSNEKYNIEDSDSSGIEWISLPVFVVLGVLLLVLSGIPGALYRFYMDDGPAEITTVICHLIACIFFIISFFVVLKKKRLWLLLIFAIFSFCVAGEEISWGQRIWFDYVPSFFMKYNSNQSINVHNMFFFEPYEDEISLSVILGWGLFLPALAFAYNGIKRLCRRTGFPCPGNIIAFCVTIVLALETLFFFTQKDYTEFGFETMELGFAIAWAITSMGLYFSLKNSVETKE